MRIESAVRAYRSVRRKKHGIGEGTRLRAFKMALAMFAVTNNCPFSWRSRFAWWLAIYGTPRLPFLKPQSRIGVYSDRTNPN